MLLFFNLLMFKVIRGKENTSSLKGIIIKLAVCKLTSAKVGGFDNPFFPMNKVSKTAFVKLHVEWAGGRWGPEHF